MIINYGRKGINPQIEYTNMSSNLLCPLFSRTYSSQTDNNQFKYLHFNNTNFTKELFVYSLLNNLRLNSTYSIIIKISFENFQIFKMCGPQIGLRIGEIHDNKYYEDLYLNIQERIFSVLELYDHDTVESYNWNSLEISYRQIETLPDLKLTSISNVNFSLARPYVKLKELFRSFNNRILPLTTDTSYFGVPIIENKYNNTIPNKLVTFINDVIKLSNLNKKNQVSKLIDDDKLFLYPDNKNTKYLIASKELDTNTYRRRVFDIKTGVLITEATDIVESQIPNNFTRKIANTVIELKNDKPSKLKVNIPLSKMRKIDNQLVERNNNIGALDLETYTCDDSIARVYALGFQTTIDRLPSLFYLTSHASNLNQDELVLTCFDSLLKPKYNNFTIYVHNLGKFDVIFIYNILLTANKRKGFEYYHLNPTFRDDVIIKLVIKIPSLSNSKRYIKISLIDSINIIPGSLEKIAKDFNIAKSKGKFPHAFVNNKTLEYIGKLPDKRYYPKITDKEYEELYSESWDLKKECLIYLERDISSLLDIMVEFSRMLYINFNTQLTDALTISRLSLNIFLKDYLKNNTIPVISNYSLFNFIHLAYYGGITEVYKPYGQDLIYIDVNSLYPYLSLNPLPGLEANYLQDLDGEGLDLNNLFGFFYAKVKTKNDYLGLLPIKNKKGLILPNGEFEGVWSSEELKFAANNGYEIVVIKGYNFNKINDVFKDYVTDLYERKKVATGSLRTIIKHLLNNLIGRFGLNIFKPITKTVDIKKRDFLASTRVIKSQKELENNLFILTYQPIISEEICTSHGYDYLKVLEKEKNINIEKNIDIFQNISVAFPAMITSYARIYMNKIKLEIINNGGNIYYSDTDSLVIDKKGFRPDLIGNEIGQFKIEYNNIAEAYFISNKTYCLVLDNGEIIIRSKGVLNDSITLNDFKDMYYNNLSIQAEKYSSKTNYSKGSVVIEKSLVNINFDSYTKREKIFDANGLWIDTKPLNFKP